MNKEHYTVNGMLKELEEEGEITVIRSLVAKKRIPQYSLKKVEQLVGTKALEESIFHLDSLRDFLTFKIIGDNWGKQHSSRDVTSAKDETVKFLIEATDSTEQNAMEYINDLMSHPAVGRRGWIDELIQIYGQKAKVMIDERNKLGFNNHQPVRDGILFLGTQTISNGFELVGNELVKVGLHLVEAVNGNFKGRTKFGTLPGIPYIQTESLRDKLTVVRLHEWGAVSTLQTFKS